MGTIVVHTVSLLKSLFTSLHSQQPHLHHHHHHSSGMHITVSKSDTYKDTKPSKNKPGFLLKELCGVVMFGPSHLMFVPANQLF
jgi:hypothetical protein